MPAAAWAETLADAVAAAYDRNPQLVQQRYLQKARDENYVQARSQYGPSVTVTTSGGYHYQSLSGRSGDADNQQTSLSISQPLYTSGQIRGQVAAARAGVLGGQEQVRLAEQQIVQDVVLVYAGVLRDQARVEIGRENVTVLEGQLRQNRKRQEIGDVTLTDVAQSDARLAAAELQLATLEADLAISRGQYLEIVGHNPGVLEPLPQLGALPRTIDMAFDLAEQNNPSFLIAQYVEQQSSASAASTRGQQGPTLSVSAEGRYSNRLLNFGRDPGTKDFITGFTLTQPIFSGGAIRSRIREADARNRADQAGIDVARRSALQAVTSAWVQLSAARTAVVTGQRQVDSAQQAFAGMSCEELNGLRATIETLNAEQELQSAQIQLVENRYQVYVSHAQLLAAVGGLSAQAIADNIKVYDPEANFQRVRYRGVTPLDLVGMGLDRIGSAGPRGPYSPDLAGENVPTPETVPLAAAPGRELMNRPLTPMTQSQLRLPNGDSARCPLLGPRPRR
ncbi:TolC family outer membrane protein [Sphingomonas crusticola]|uniref:TolC family outer membrane protein n=1 Tax=Sphingomonas crusticola TaxID=1697973 RepID=UPI0013C2B7D3|nr:TolC family outer membrane protein [Sphingomonas crusticola]